MEDLSGEVVVGRVAVERQLVFLPRPVATHPSRHRILRWWVDHDTSMSLEDGAAPVACSHPCARVYPRVLHFSSSTTFFLNKTLLVPKNSGSTERGFCPYKSALFCNLVRRFRPSDGRGLSINQISSVRRMKSTGEIVQGRTFAWTIYYSGSTTL